MHFGPVFLLRPESPAAHGSVEPAVRTLRPKLLRIATGLSAALALLGVISALRPLVPGPPDLSQVAVFYLLGVVVLAVRYGLVAALAAAVLGGLACDFFFVPPLFEFGIGALRHAVTLLAMVTAGVIVSGLTERLRRARERASAAERRMAIPLELERELAAALDSAAIARVTIGYLHRVLDLTVSVFLFQNGELHQAPVEAPSAEASSKRIVEQGIAHGKPLWDAMRKTGVVPLRSAQQSFGGVLVQPRAATELDPAETRLVELSCLEIARALERICLAKQAEDARLQAETEQLRSGILSAVSHDLRTPLATISASAQMLANTSDALSPSARRGVLNGIAAQAERLGALVHRLQVMSRLESSNVQAELVLGDVADVVAAAARRSRERFGAQRLEIVAPRRLPLVRMDAVLLEQVFENLLENAAKFSPDDAPVRVELEAAGGSIRVLVEDQGPGIPDDELEHVFEKFYRGRHATRHAGSGLGLAICRAVVQAHRGSITFERQRPKGACARVELPAQHVSDAALAFHLPEPL